MVVTAEIEQPGAAAQARVEDVAECASAATWSVEEQGWKDVVPTLSDETIELLAPPVIVSTETCDAGLIRRPPPRLDGAARGQ